VVSVVDTNCDPDLIDHKIPGNDDAIRAIRLFCAAIAEAVIDGRNVFEERQRGAGADERGGGDEAPALDGGGLEGVTEFARRRARDSSIARRLSARPGVTSTRRFGSCANAGSPRPPRSRRAPRRTARWGPTSTRAERSAS
jgi:hypothetical protein